MSISKIDFPHIQSCITRSLYIFLLLILIINSETCFAQTFQPIDYWTFNNANARNDNASTATLNGGALGVCYTCATGKGNYSPSSPPQGLWASLVNNASVNTGQLNFPLNSQDSIINVNIDSKVFAISSQAKAFTPDNNPWNGAKLSSKVREASLEFLMKPNGLQRGLIIHTAFGQFMWKHNGFEASLRLNGGLGYPLTQINIPFSNLDRLSPAYYYPDKPNNSSNSNSNWHHIVITVKTYDLTMTPPSDKNPGLAATVCFWVDGQKIAEKEIKSKIVTDGTFAGSQFIVNATNSIEIGESKDPENKTPISSTYPKAYYFEGLLDEIALYNKVIPPTLIYQHYTETLEGNSLKGSGKYTFTVLNPKQAIPAFQMANMYDPKEIPPMDIYEGNTIAKQFSHLPLPRFKPGHQLLRNVNLSLNFLNTDKYMESQGKKYLSQDNVQRLNWELARKWNYYLCANVLWGASDIGTNFRTQANAPENSDLPIAYSFFSDIYPKTPTPNCNIQYDPNDKSSFFADEKGKVLNTQYKPGGNNHDYELLANKVKQQMEGYWAGKTWDVKTCTYLSSTNDIPFNRPFALLIDDDEHKTLVPISTYYNRSAGMKSIKSDPAVWDDYNRWLEKQMAGNRSVYHYEAENRFMHHKGNYKKAFMNVQNTNGAIDKNTKFATYQWGNFWEYLGVREYQLKNKEEYYASNSNYANDPSKIDGGSVRIREIIYEITKPTIGDRHISQSYAFSGYGNDKGGWDWSVINTHEEIVTQDKRSTRPAEALGYTKYMAILGTEFHYLYYGRCGCYSKYINNCADNPNAILWQYLIPVYTQGITSRYEDIFRNGTVMLGNLNYPTTGYGTTQIAKEYRDIDIEKPITPNDNHTKYTFNTHDNRIVVGARKLGPKYAIATAILNLGNEVKIDNLGNIIERNAPLTATATFNLEKDIQLKVNTRRQGSVYIFDNSNPNSPIFYQLDQWHQYEHPYYWSRNFFFEAELFDNSSNSDAFKIVSNVPAPLISNGQKSYDMTNITTSIAFLKKDNPAEYHFEPRSENDAAMMNYDIRIKLKKNSNDAIALDFYIDNAPIGTINNIAQGTEFEWVKLSTSLHISANKDHVLSIKPKSTNNNSLNTLFIDAIELISTDKEN